MRKFMTMLISVCLAFIFVPVSPGQTIGLVPGIADLQALYPERQLLLDPPCPACDPIGQQDVWDKLKEKYLEQECLWVYYDQLQETLGLVPGIPGHCELTIAEQNIVNEAFWQAIELCISNQIDAIFDSTLWSDYFWCCFDAANCANGATKEICEDMFWPPALAMDQCDCFSDAFSDAIALMLTYCGENE